MNSTRTCSACWTGTCNRGFDGAGEDCSNCGMPGPKPADYDWKGQPVTHYINHGNTWQSAPAVAGDPPNKAQP